MANETEIKRLEITLSYLIKQDGIMMKNMFLHIIFTEDIFIYLYQETG